MPQLKPVYDRAIDVIDAGKNITDMFSGGKPSGITIHYTADDNVERVLKTLGERGLAYHLIIDRDGSVIQNCYLINSCDHAGRAKWNGKSPNRNHIAIAVVSWGLLHENKDGTLSTWAGNKFLKEDAVFEPDNVYGNESWWQPATVLQYQVLLDACAWLCQAAHIDPEDICGHDECALPLGRKFDPGGVLPVSMSGLRMQLIQRLKMM